MNKRIDLGAVTAYAIAVKNGFKATLKGIFKWKK